MNTERHSQLHIILPASLPLHNVAAACVSARMHPLSHVCVYCNIHVLSFYTSTVVSGCALSPSFPVNPSTRLIIILPLFIVSLSSKAKWFQIINVGGRSLSLSFRPLCVVHRPSVRSSQRRSALPSTHTTLEATKPARDQSKERRERGNSDTKLEREKYTVPPESSNLTRVLIAREVCRVKCNDSRTELFACCSRRIGAALTEVVRT